MKKPTQCLKKRMQTEEITEGLIEMGMKAIALDMGMVPSNQLESDEVNDLTDQEIELLKSTRSENEWDLAVDEIIRAHGNQYPANWYEVVILGGICPDPTIHITTERK